MDSFLQNILPSPPSSAIDCSPPIIDSRLLRHESPASQTYDTPIPFNAVSLPSHPVVKCRHSPAPGTTAHPYSAMAYAQLPNGLSFSYPNLPPSDEASAYDIDNAVAPTAQSYNLTTPEASPHMQPQQLADGMPVRAGSVPRGTQGLRVLGVRSGRIEKNTPKKKPASLSASPPTTRKNKTGRPVSRSASTKTETAPAAPGSSDALGQPLSVLTKDWDIPFVDIDAYVRRSVDERRQEVDRGKVPGKVKRAMNAFMLYRKAYQDRAKKWAQQSNHQVVSKVCGQSWSIEPESVRNQFNDWAVIERDNHRKAHPEYKFTPSKPRKKGKDGLDDESDLDDPDWDGSRRLGSHHPLHPHHRGVSLVGIDDADFRRPRAAYPPPYATAADLQGVPPFQAYHHRPPPHLANLAGHSPAPYDTDDRLAAAGGMHYHPVQAVPTQPQQHHHHHMEGVGGFAQAHPQNMGMVPTPNLSDHHQHQRQQHQHHQHHHQQRQPPPQHQQQHQHHQHHQHQSQHSFGMGDQFPPQDMEQQHQLGSIPPPHAVAGIGQQIDPSLVTRDGLQQYDMSGPVLTAGGLDEPQWPAGLPLTGESSTMFPGPYFAELDESYMQEAQMQYLRGDEESWKIEPVHENEWHQQNEQQ